MTIRDIRQKEFSDIFLQERRDGILYLCPRFGKCRVAINLFKAKQNPRVLIAYPDKGIKASWTDEFEKTEFKNNKNIEFTTHMSIKKHSPVDLDLLVIDEIHLLSPNQINEVKKNFKNKVRILGLTGTLSEKTEISLSRSLGLPVLAKYTIMQAIEEGIISDYHITVKVIPLDKKNPVKIGRKVKSEKAHFDAYTYVINKLEEDGKSSMFIRLSRMRIIQGSITKLNETRKLLQEFINERVLIFCGVTKITDQLGCPVYHSKNQEKQLFLDFANGIGHNHMAVVKLGNTGQTYMPLSKVIINYFDSNSENLAQKIFRCMAVEYWDATKKADIWIVSSDEETEINWLNKALEFFDSDKISYV